MTTERNDIIVWKDIPGLDGFYQASENGMIRSFKKKGLLFPPRILKRNKDKSGYVRVKITHNKKEKYRSVSRLVALTHIPNPNNLPEVNHLNGDKEDCSKKNLEWTDRSGNMIHAHATGLKVPREQWGENNFSSKYKEDDIINIYSMIKGGMTNSEISISTGIMKEYINLIRTGKRWKKLFEQHFKIAA